MTLSATALMPLAAGAEAPFAGTAADELEVTVLALGVGPEQAAPITTSRAPNLILDDIIRRLDPTL